MSLNYVALNACIPKDWPIINLRAIDMLDVVREKRFLNTLTLRVICVICYDSELTVC